MWAAPEASKQHRSYKTGQIRDVSLSIRAANQNQPILELPFKFEKRRSKICSHFREHANRQKKDQEGFEREKITTKNNPQAARPRETYKIRGEFPPVGGAVCGDA